MSRRAGRHDAPIEPASGWLALIGAIVDGTVALPRAACRGLAPSFDVERARGQRHGGVSPAAVEICRTCPERALCGLWARDAPPGTVSGVLGDGIWR
ncbi:MAG TPA: hypothetical protein VME67_17490 [Mycobacterium sp.]|nr:hypothetical protein [Mycobacterium sp.]HTX96494.1 hypothetical protein [Mycobacterium sp.]